MTSQRNRKLEAKQRMQFKRFYRRMRSILKKRSRKGASFSKKEKSIYHLNKSRLLWFRSKENRQKRTVDVPVNFCFLEDANNTLNFLKKLDKKLQNKGYPVDIHVSHKETKKIGLAASYLFDELIDSYKRYWRKQGIKIEVSGNISHASKDVNNFLLSFGLLKTLGIENGFNPRIVDKDYKDKYVTFKITGNKKEAYLLSNGSTGIVEYFNACFRHNELELTPTTFSDLTSVFGEIIGNAEEHSGTVNGDWIVLGCYNKEDHMCHFSILNKGRTFYESLSSPESTAFTSISKIKQIISKHRPLLEKAHGLWAKDYEEPIWNVMALQDGISSRRTNSGTSSTRGQGIMDVLSFIDAVKCKKRDSTKLAVISGRSAIYIDYKYPITEKTMPGNGERRKQITFNRQNDLHFPPDKKCIFLLDNKFEGAIFSGKFNIDPKYLKKKIASKK